MDIRAWSSLLELENSMSLSYYPKPELEKNPIFKDCQNPNSKKTRKFKLDRIQFWPVENFGKKLCIQAKFWSKFSLKPVNSKTRWVFLKPEKLELEKLGKFETRKTQTRI